ncbi:MAG TPA: hypothetical protein VI136_04215, partial [Verrucomicrobiae bacterium]
MGDPKHATAGGGGRKGLGLHYKPSICAKSFVTGAGWEAGGKRVVAPKVGVTHDMHDFMSQQTKSEVLGQL